MILYMLFMLSMMSELRLNARVHTPAICLALGATRNDIYKEMISIKLSIKLINSVELLEHGVMMPSVLRI